MKTDTTVRRPFIEHVAELRARLLVPLVVMFVGAIAGYFIRDYTQTFLLAPLNQPLYYSSPIGGFEFVFKLSLFIGIVAAVPVLIYNALKFVEPVVPHRVRWLIAKVLVASTLLALAGMAFAYFVSLPAALHFLGNFGAEGIHSWISTNEYLSFVMIYLAGFALLFQLPLILLFFNNITPMKPRRLLRKQRWVIVGSFIAAALITPTPDPANQAIMAGPIIVLYQISIGLVWGANRRRIEIASFSRILDPPTPTYTAGLLEEIPDRALVPARPAAVQPIPQPVPAASQLATVGPPATSLSASAHSASLFGAHGRVLDLRGLN